MSRIDQDSAYFLHQTPYRDNSAIVHLLSRQHGKLSFIVSGLKAKKNAKRPFLQPCRRLVIDYQLRTGLCKLLDIDFASASRAQSVPPIEQFMLYQYANELLLTVLPEQLPVTSLFDDYTQFLQYLAGGRTHLALRHIELALLILFSGLPNLNHTEDSRQAVDADKHYYLYPERGLFVHPQNEAGGIALDGTQIQAFQHLVHGYVNADSDHLSETLAQGGKAISSALIQPLLNGKTLKTRVVYRALQEFI
ncbi:MAG: DNA repair protein RecO [Gammaproteobacteria bacterium]|nr:MAG: DNA repair protein RecO [Gammaproteobacteria bacterium]